jgi:hypothetical protein
MIYFPQRSLTDCLLTGLECLLQKPRESMNQSALDFYEGGYLSYRSVGRILSIECKRYGVMQADIVPHLWRESIPMLIGARMPRHKLSEHGRALHCVFWDGRGWLWEPHEQRFMDEDLRELRVAYAIVSEDSKMNRKCGDLSWFDAWDKNCRRFHALPPGERQALTKQANEIEMSGDRSCWLEVVG